MVGRSLLMTSLLAFLALSGCLEGGTDGAETEALDADDGGDTGGTTSTGTTGADQEPAADPLQPTPQPFSWQGSVGGNVYACAVVTCTGYSLGGWDNTRDVTGIVSGELTLTWDTPVPLSFGLATYCDNGCRFVTADSGTSSVTLTFDGLDPEKRYVLVAWHAYRSVGPAGTQAGPQTEFRVDGTVMAV